MRNDIEFEQIVRENIASLSAYARSTTRNQWIAEEAVQETLIRAWRYWPTFRNESTALSWLITICRRVIIDIVSRTPTHDEINTRDNTAVQENHVIGLQEMIINLPLSQREVIVLCAVIGFDYETVAEILDVPIGTVRSRLSRARQSLASQLETERREAM